MGAGLRHSDSRRVAVLGSRGMLGSMVKCFLQENGCEVVEPDMRFSVTDAREYFARVVELSVDWCINCVVARASHGRMTSELWAANALLPQCCNVLLPEAVGVIHASTDAVFAPDKSCRSIDETPDAIDLYGWSKRLAEIGMIGPRRYIIRCSVIGPEAGPPRSLLGRVLAQEATLSGFTNHWWNGITSLEWARISHSIVFSNGESPQLLQPAFWPAITKYDLLQKILSQFGSNTELRAVEAKQPVLRTLVPSLALKSIDDQLAELYDYATRHATGCRWAV